MKIFPAVRHPLGRLPDNNDSALKYYELILENNHPEAFRPLPLPEGFHFSTFQPGDEEEWIAIETSAREFVTRREGLEAWQHYYGGREEELPGRMYFVETETGGKKVATATAYYEPEDLSGAGWLHWVAVRRGVPGQRAGQTADRSGALSSGAASLSLRENPHSDQYLAGRVHLSGFRFSPLRAQPGTESGGLPDPEDPHQSSGAA